MKNLSIIVIVMVAAADAHAGGFAVAEQSTTAAGTGSAGTARTDDASAAWFNPAALADAGGWRIGFGILAAQPNLTARAMDGSWETDSESGWSTPPHINASFAHGDFAAGVALGVSHGSGVTWPADWPGRFEIVRSRMEVFRASPFMAWRLGKWRVAGGLHIDAARLRVGRQLDFIDTEGEVFIDMDGRGIGFDAAVFYEAHDDVDVGLSYKSRTGIDFAGGADFDATPDAFSMKTVDQNASAHVTIPDRIALGTVWRAGEWTVLGDLEMTMWGVYDELVIDFENEATPDARQTNNWSNTVAVRAGTEWRFAPGWVGRGGAFYDPSPAQDDTLAPSSPDSSRIGLTLGATRALGSDWYIDAFAEHLQLMGRQSQNEDSLAAEYSGSARLFGVGVRYQR